MNAYRNVKFEHLGYSLDYHVAGKYYGSINIDEPDREVIGYSGKKTCIAKSNIVLNNKLLYYK